MNLGMQGPDEGGSGLARGVVVIVVVGIALGVTFNAMQLKSGPRRGLAWINHEVKLASLESVANAAESAPAASTGGTDSSQAASQAASPAAQPATQVRTDSTGADSAHAARRPKSGKSAKGSKPAAAASKTSKPHGAAATTPTAATTAPAAAAKTTDLPTVPDTKEPLEVQFATIKKLWDAGAALFVDARSADEYAEGHIPGAVSMPFDDVFKDPDKAKHLDTHDRKVVITYCGGGDCDLSRNLAFSLIDAGHKKVLVFLGGLPGWKDAGNAAATGKTPGTAP